jgi:hypothetical protein
VADCPALGYFASTKHTIHKQSSKTEIQEELRVVAPDFDRLIEKQRRNKK